MAEFDRSSANHLYGDVSLSRILSRTGQVAGGNLAVMMVVAIVPVVLATFFTTYGIQMIGTALRGASFGGTNPYWFGGSALLLGFALSALAQGSLVRFGLDSLQGRRADPTEALLRTVLKLPQLFMLVMIMQVAIMAATILLIVPGVLLSIVWCVAVPALMVEERGVAAAFGRSQMLSSGARWKVLGLYALFWVAWLILNLVQGMISRSVYGVSTPSFLGITLPVTYIVASGLLYTAMGVFSAAMHAALYVELRDWKEGAPGAALTEIFA